jgi:hypothetical protein
VEAIIQQQYPTMEKFLLGEGVSSTVTFIIFFIHVEELYYLLFDVTENDIL